MDNASNFSIIQESSVINDIKFNNLVQYGENTITINVNADPKNDISVQSIKEQLGKNFKLLTDQKYA